MLGKAVAGIVLGGVLSSYLLALGLWPLPAHGQAILIPALVSFIPLWIGVIAASFMFSSAWRAWLSLGLLDLLGYLCLQWLHHLRLE